MAKMTKKLIVNKTFPRPMALLELVVLEDSITVRAYNEMHEPTEELPEREDLHIGLPHQYENQLLMQGRQDQKPIRGELLKPELAGKWFYETSSAMVKRGWFEGQGEWTDNGLWCFPISYEGMLEVPFNSTTENVDRKGTAKRAAAQRRQHDVVLVFMPFADAPFTDCSIVVRTGPDGAVFGNVGEFEEKPGLLGDFVNDLRPAIRLKSGGGDIPAETREVTVVEIFDPMTGAAITDSGATLFLETTGGYLPRQRVKVAADGTAAFPVMALGLDAGETFKVKVGFKQYTGMLDVPFSVI